MSTLTRGLEELTRRVEEAASMEDAYLAIRTIEFLGPFYAFQMVADLGEHGLLTFRYFHHPHLSHLSHLSSPPLLTSTHLQPSENSFVVLGGGAERGLRVVEGEVRADLVLQLKYLAKVSGGGGELHCCRCCSVGGGCVAHCGGCDGYLWWLRRLFVEVEED